MSEISTEVESLDITTYDDDGNIIDENGAEGGFEIADSDIFTSASIDYEVDAMGTGSIDVFLQPLEDIITGDEIVIYLPSGFSIPAGESLTCQLGTALFSSFTIVGQIITIEIDDDTHITAASGGSITLDTTVDGIKYPIYGTSYSNIIEWVIDITHSLTSETGNIQSTLNPSSFAVDIDVIYTDNEGLFVPYTFKVEIDTALTIINSRALWFELEFDTSLAFPSALGTGYINEGDIPCTSNLEDLSSTIPVACTLTPGDPTTVKISQFKTVTKGSVISITLFIQNGASGNTVSIPIKSGFTDYNGISTIVQEGTALVSFIDAASNFATHVVESNNTLVGMMTPMNITLQLPSADSEPDDKLLLTFPSKWAIDIKNLFIQIDGNELSNYQLFVNSYAPAIMITLDEDVISSTASNIITLMGMTNAPYEGAGAGEIQISLVKNETMDIIATSLVDIDPAVRNELILSVSPNSLRKLAGDVTFRFTITNTAEIPASGKIIIVFPSGFDLTHYSCSYSYVLSSSASCTKIDQIITVSGFKTIAAATTFSIRILTIKTPDQTSSGPFTVTTLYTSDTNDVIDEAINDGYLMNSAAVAGSSYVSNLSFFPMTAGSAGIFVLEFSLDSSVPKDGLLTITVPSTFTLPTLSASNCLFNLHYSDCTKFGSSILIIPIRSFPAGIQMKLSIPGITVPSNSNIPIIITSTWNSLTMSDNPIEPNENFYLNTYMSSGTSLSASLDFWPKNAAEMASYKFTIITASGLDEDSAIVIWFPSTYPTAVNEINCWSSASLLEDQYVSCHYEYPNGIIVKGFNITDPGVQFFIQIQNVYNPPLAGSAGSFSIASVNSSSHEVIDSLSSLISATITSIPSVLNLVSISLGSYNTRASTSYTFQSAFASIPSTFEI